MHCELQRSWRLRHVRMQLCRSNLLLSFGSIPVRTKNLAFSSEYSLKLDHNWFLPLEIRQARSIQAGRMLKYGPEFNWRRTVKYCNTYIANLTVVTCVEEPGVYKENCYSKWYTEYIYRMFNDTQNMTWIAMFSMYRHTTTPI